MYGTLLLVSSLILVACQDDHLEVHKRSLPGMAEFCKLRKDGKLYPDPFDCRAYIYCSGGYAYRALCGKGLYYDEETQMCDYDFGSCTGKKTTARSFSPAIHTDHAAQKTYPTTRLPPGQSYRPLSGASPERKDIVHTKDDVINTSRAAPKEVTTAKTVKENEDDVIHKQTSERTKDSATDIDSFCFRREDGRYPHPEDCHSYILCSNSYTYSITCPNGLVFAPGGHGCNFDHSGYCDKTKDDEEDGTADAESSGGTQPASYLRLSSADQRQAPAIEHYSYGDKELNAQLPHAIEEAMTALMKLMEEASDLALRMKGRMRPFKLVQRFLKAQPLAMHLSMPGFVIANASSILLKQLGNGATGGLSALQSFGSPLSANSQRLRPDSSFPTPEPATCPWPRYICDTNAKYRSFDGSCNNMVNPILGRSFTPAQRFVKPDYGDEIQSLRLGKFGNPLPAARSVSSTINDDRPIRHHIHSALLLQWGQFVDHDLTLTAITQIPLDPTGLGDTVDIECGSDGCATDIASCQPIDIPDDDPDFRDEKCLEFVRSQGVPNLDCSMGPREQLNQLTSFLDASNVYGSTRQDADRLRDFADSRRGRLKSITHPRGFAKKRMLPTTTDDEDCNEFHSSPCFQGGDERVNEHNTLTVMHTLWMREHNRIEERLHALNPHWSGDTLFQESRKIIGAMLQHITFAEFLPLVLGDGVISREGLRLQKYDHYMGYDSTVDPRISSGFATAAYRFGHTLLMPTFRRLDKQLKEISSAKLSELFFRPGLIVDEGNGGIDALARGLAHTRCMQVDRHVTKEVTAKLFSEHPPHGLGTDLVSLNIQRGRDHGIPGYNTYREWCGLRRATSFDDLQDIPNPDVRNKFKKLYKHVDDIDLFPAGLSEKGVNGGLVGPTFACIIGRQFSKLRKGDRFWYENPGPNGFSAAQLNEIRKATLSKVICQNADDIDEIQPAGMDVPFREAYPDNSYPQNANGLPMDWYTIMWRTDMNSPRNCSSLPEVDLTAWKE